ncbi:GNAT family N-acetyltransferase [Salinibacterium sp. NG253]|uniref:GNAT family N-acetyltransferase n=1 Tax=Salinibacterium sp. NG253 TaxID=2792039 RepID=UPI0018CF0CE4|nr:GNAT family N-acetyltransferase [Salinibacterium sp. NG253]MBH0117311.1 GNAT family N-acetyltransferase [Salinibacterium sp. NG253]
MYSPIVFDYWLPTYEREPAFDALYVVRVAETLPTNTAVTLLDVAAGPSIVSLVPSFAERLDFTKGQRISAEQLRSELDAAGVALNGADQLFYLPRHAQDTLRAEVIPETTRQLTEADAAAFEKFTAAIPERELDEAFVELDHWLVYGTFTDDQLVAASSMYPWRGSQLADLGIITLPEHRGRGLATRTVRAISARALADGYEPQYRCQPDNAGSVAVALAAGFTLFGQWDVVPLND